MKHALLEFLKTNNLPHTHLPECFISLLMQFSGGAKHPSEALTPQTLAGIRGLSAGGQEWPVKGLQLNGCYHLLFPSRVK